MSTKIQIIKRLEIIKNLIELEDEETIHIQIEKLKEENNSELKSIIEILENDDYEKINRAIDDYVYGYKNAEMTPHQKEVFDAVNSDIDEVLKNYKQNGAKTYKINFLSLSGSAGVGKTFVTSKLVEEFIKKEYKVLLTTPTHKSLSVAKYMINSNSIHINAKTLQSYLDLKLNTDYLSGTKVFKRDKKADQHDYEKNLDILIVDESSMVSNELLHFIEENLHQNKLKTVLFIGDQYQLPPIDEGSNGVVQLPKQYKLTEIVRQAKDSYIKVIANEIKNCIRNKKYIPFSEILDPAKYPQLQLYYEEQAYLDDFTKKPHWSKDRNILIAYTNQEVDEQNKLIRYRFWKDQGVVATDAILKEERLIFNTNYDGKFANSEVVTVSKAEKRFDEIIKIYYWECKDTIGRSFKVIDPDYIIQFNKYVTNLATKAKQTPKSDAQMIKKRWYRYFITKETYADVKYTFASTVHKVQGSTYDTAYISIASMASLANRNDQDIAYRLLYVAVTRASKDVKILL